MAQRAVFNNHNLIDSNGAHDRHHVTARTPSGAELQEYYLAYRTSSNMQHGNVNHFHVETHRHQALYEDEMARRSASMHQERDHYQEQRTVIDQYRVPPPFHHRPPELEYDEQRQYWPTRRFSEPEPHANLQHHIRERGRFSEVHPSSSLQEHEPHTTSSSSSNPISYSLPGSPLEQVKATTKGLKMKGPGAQSTSGRNYSTQQSVSSNHPYGSSDSSATGGTEHSSKNEVKRLKNREAAARCRHRRKQMLQDLQETVDQLTLEKETAVRELERQLQDLQGQVKQLTALKEEHENIISALTHQLHNCLGYDRRSSGNDRAIKTNDEG